MKKLLIALFSLFLCGNAYAVGTATINGIPITRIDTGKLQGISAEFFTDYVFGTSGVYNESGSTTVTDGRVYTGDVSPNSGIKTIAVDVRDINGGGTLTVKFYGFIGTDTTPVLVHSADYGTLTGKGSTTTYGTGSTAGTVNIVEYTRWLNIYAFTSTGTITATITGEFLDKL